MSEGQEIERVNEVDLAVVNNSSEESSENTNVIEVEYADIRKKALELRNKVGEDYWELSIVLSDIYTNDRYRSWGFDSWKDYVDKELDFTIRKAQYMVKIQSWFDTLTPAMQEFFRSLGWVKCRMLMPVVVKENAKSWKKKIEGKTLKEIEGIIKGNKVDISSGGSSGESSGESISPSDSLVRRSFSLYTGQDEVVTNAINRAKDIGETDKDGHALSLVCMDYLASSTDLIDMTSLFKHMEDITGLRIVAFKTVDGDRDEIVFGSEYLDVAEESEKENDNNSE
jgi:hypothetical protein